jgi:hypothetical protein
LYCLVQVVLTELHLGAASCQRFFVIFSIDEEQQLQSTLMQCMLGGSFLERALLSQATRHVQKIIRRVDTSSELVRAQHVTDVRILPETQSATAIRRPQVLAHVDHIGC